ncbi:MAG: hypothetical protein AAGJ46_07995 [Planctomycetota bacterium]
MNQPTDPIDGLRAVAQQFRATNAVQRLLADARRGRQTGRGYITLRFENGRLRSVSSDFQDDGHANSERIADRGR